MNFSDKMINEFCEKKEAFIMEELQPYFKDGKMCQKVNLRLAEIKDFKNLANQKFEQFIKDLKKDIDESADKTDIWDNERWDKFRKVLIKAIKKRAGDGLI